MTVQKDELESLILKYNELPEKEENEYIGINISDSANGKCTFKIYRSITDDLLYSNNNDDLYKAISKRNMIKAIHKIMDTSVGKVRYDFSLLNRDNENIKFLLDLIHDVYPSEKIYNQILSLAQIKIVDDEDYKYSSLYFFSYKEECKLTDSQQLEQVNIDFILQKTDKPDLVYCDYGFDNDFFSCELRKIKCEQIDFLLDVYNNISENTHCNLWLCAVDISRSGKVKYKLYIKGGGESLYDSIIKYFCTSENMASSIYEISEEMKRNENMKPYGAAIAIDNLNSKSINFYYK